ncbi:hypothetical protein AgCh_007222 [Apium graveolens]
MLENRTEEEEFEEEIDNQFYETDFVGAIDGTHIPAMIKGRDVSIYHMEESDNLESNMSSQQQQMTEANTWRATIANSMWEDRPRNSVNEEYEQEQYDESEEHNGY